MSKQTGIDRLRRIRESNEAAAVEMVTERARFDAIREQGSAVAVSAFNLFQTPASIAHRLAQFARDGARVLEPSAGLGRIVRAVQARCEPSELVAVEIAPQCCEQLYRIEGVRLVQDDFLRCDVERLGGLFDVVAMNPPFKQGLDIKHILHAWELVAPGGVLVSLCFDGVRQNEKLRGWADSWEVLPADSFKSEGTRAGVALLTKTKRG